MQDALAVPRHLLAHAVRRDHPPSTHCDICRSIDRSFSGLRGGEPDTASERLRHALNHASRRDHAPVNTCVGCQDIERWLTDPHYRGELQLSLVPNAIKAMRYQGIIIEQVEPERIRIGFRPMRGNFLVRANGPCDGFCARLRTLGMLG